MPEINKEKWTSCMPPTARGVSVCVCDRCELSSAAVRSSRDRRMHACTHARQVAGSLLPIVKLSTRWVKIRMPFRRLRGKGATKRRVKTWQNGGRESVLSGCKGRGAASAECRLLFATCCLAAHQRDREEDIDQDPPRSQRVPHRSGGGCCCCAATLAAAAARRCGDDRRRPGQLRRCEMTMTVIAVVLESGCDRQGRGGRCGIRGQQRTQIVC
jgi:hypothetical protein